MVTVVVVVMFKVLVWAVAVISTLLKVKVRSPVVIVLKFAGPVSDAVDVLFEVVVDVLTAMKINVASGIGVGMLADVKGNEVARVMTASKFAMPTPLEECSC